VGLRALQALAILLTALALVPSGAHLFALPNKLALSREAYLNVQAIYRGWALFGFVLCGALIANGALALAMRGAPARFRLALAGCLLIAATLAIFFVWTYPANQVTHNWTVAADGWQALRAQWEYSHAANAVLTFLALIAVTLAALADGGCGPIR
jgi:hypothetical protein